MQIVKVRLRKPSRVVVVLGDEELRIENGGECIVESDRGLEFGTCILPPESCPEGDEKNYAMSVVRKATLDDESTCRQIAIEEDKAKRICIDKIAARDLPMKLVDAEYTFDRKKVVFYFTAEDRVDFRELVRDLAHDLKTRIELRHIQVRDQAKMVGGIGSCGRELCCTTWLREFMPISMKMAKRQNLSLNPSKISGQCGRLMCCLSYENDLYEKRKKAKPEAEAQPEQDETPVPEEVIEDPVLEEMAAPADDVEVPANDLGPDQAPEGGRDDAPAKRKRRRRRKRRPSGAPAGEATSSSGHEQG